MKTRESKAGDKGEKHGPGHVSAEPTVPSDSGLRTDKVIIEKMIEALGQNEMPPEEKLQPSDPQRKFMLLELDKALKNATANSRPVVPLRLRRMNRFEYGNAVRDLFELRSWVYSINDRIIRNHNDYFRPESGEMPKVVRVGNRIMGLQQMLENRLLGVMAFPKDPQAENGFNNRGDHLSMSPALMESFLELSRSVVNAENFDKNCGVWNNLFGDPSNPKPATRVVALTADSSVMARSAGLTLSAWIRPSKTLDAWQTVVRREDGWQRQLLAIGRTGETWGLWMGAGIAGRYEEFGAPVEPKLLGDGKWHHVAGTFDGKQLNLYVDGKRVELLRCNYMMRGVLLNAGSNSVRFTYRPNLFGFLAGALVSGLLIVWACVRGVNFLRRTIKNTITDEA